MTLQECAARGPGPLPVCRHVGVHLLLHPCPVPRARLLVPPPRCRICAKGSRDSLGARQELPGSHCASCPRSTILIPRKGWHMLLNLCFHIAMTAAVFAGGITLTGYRAVCQAVGTGWDGHRGARPCPQHPLPNRRLLPQVGIILHYSSLSTLLWMAVKARVLYKEVTWKAPQQPDRDTSQAAPRPMLRYGPPLPRHRGGISRGWGGTCSSGQAHPVLSRRLQVCSDTSLPAGST